MPGVGGAKKRSVSNVDQARMFHLCIDVAYLSHARRSRLEESLCLGNELGI